MKIRRCNRSFEYMLDKDIHVIYKTHNINTPSFYIEEIKFRHPELVVYGFNISDSTQYIGNKTLVLYELKGVLLTATVNQLMKSKNVSKIRYTDDDIVYVANCILLKEGLNVRCTGYTPSPIKNKHSVYGNYECNLICDICSHEFNRKMKHIAGNRNASNCINCKSNKDVKTFNGDFSAYFYVNKFIYADEIVYKYGVSHNITNRMHQFKCNNGIESENIIAVLFESSLDAADLEGILKTTNLINHMTHVKIKDGCTELTDEKGLEFIKEELKYMNKI